MLTKTVTRLELTEKIRKDSGLSRAQSLNAIDVVLQEMVRCLKTEREVKIPLFGVFSLRHKRARMGRNPRTMEEATISERNVVRFRVSRLMKERVEVSCRKKQK